MLPALATGEQKTDGNIGPDELASRGGLDDLLNRGKPGGKPRRPVPTPQELIAAEIAVKDLFKDELKTKNTEARRSLAATLVKHALESGDQPASQYVLFQHAISQAVAAKDVALTMSTAAHLAAEFEVDGQKLKVDELNKVAKGATDPATVEAVVAASLDLTADLIDSELFAQAVRTSSLAVSGASRSGSKHAKGLATLVDKRAKTLLREREKVAKHLTTLEKEPENAKANEAAGRYYCLIQGDWSTGLPMLALSDDSRLRQIGEQEMATARDDGSQWLKLGNLWAGGAEALSVDERPAAYGRARYWYQLALPTAHGLGRVEIQNKLAKLPSPQFQLHVHVENVHGKEELHLSAKDLVWRHLTWKMPDGVVINGLNWNPAENTKIANRGATQLLPTDLDWSTVQVQKLKGRGPVTATHSVSSAVIHIDDTPDAYDDYDFVITFGR